MNAWKYLVSILVFTLSIDLYGCATGTPDYSSLVQQTNKKNTPLLIYNTSWNSPHSGTNRLAVWVANNLDKQINSIELTVAGCGPKGAVGDSYPLILGGPFYGNTQYVSLPSWPIEARNYPSAGYVYVEDAKTSGHMVIQSVEITYADGTQLEYSKNIDQILAKNITNFCPIDTTIIDSPLH